MGDILASSQAKKPAGLSGMPVNLSGLTDKLTVIIVFIMVIVQPRKCRYRGIVSAKPRAYRALVTNFVNSR